MSTVMRPRGPLPPRIYWTRRALLVGLLIVVVALVWWLMPGGGRSGASADPGTRTTPTTPADTHRASTPHRSPPTTTTQHPVTSPHHGSHSSTTPTQHDPTTPVHTTTPPPVPTGPCDPANVALTIDVGHAVVGKGVRVGLRMATSDGSTCSLGLMPSRLEVDIGSGAWSVWHSTTCPDGLPAKNVVVSPRSAVVYAIRWDGHIDPNACRTGPRVAQDGRYWVKAAIVGGEPGEVHFDLLPAG